MAKLKKNWLYNKFHYSILEKHVRLKGLILKSEQDSVVYVRIGGIAGLLKSAHAESNESQSMYFRQSRAINALEITGTCRLVVQHVKLLSVILATHIRTGSCPHCSNLIQLHVNGLEKASKDGASVPFLLPMWETWMRLLT